MCFTEEIASFTLPSLIKAFSYLRVSGKGQIVGDGFPRQRETVERYAKKHRVKIEQEFRDEGVSGAKDAFDRVGLTDLFVAIKANGVRTVLVERADRIARDLMISEIILAECRKLGVRVVEAGSGTELTVEDGDPTRTLIRQILGALAEWDKAVTVQKLRAARTRIRRTGRRCEGRKPYGASSEEGVVILRMKELHARGMSISQIARTFNDEKVKPRSSRRAGRETKWHPTAIQRILAREGQSQGRRRG